ncbi:hypothetical protein [Streptomyces sp. bgisy100]|uniref:hypothetical protein n=1 Tax=Streptomyces sp. bgisy100 TaxID=3413783 RepID=UPI003D7444C5
MPAAVDPSTVPPSPVLTIVLMTDGSVSVDGDPVPPGDDPRAAGLREATVKAAFLGRPVRVNAKEPDGSLWPLVVGPDGAVTAVESPHPVPRPAQEWNAAPSPEYAAYWDRIRAAEGRGDLPAAVGEAAELVAELGRRFGPDHPQTVNALHMQAYLALVARDHPQASWLHVQVALRRVAAAAPHDATLQVARNAYAAWKEVADPATAVHIGGEVLAMWKAVARTEKDQRMVRRTEQRLADLTGRPPVG